MKSSRFREIHALEEYYLEITFRNLFHDTGVFYSKQYFQQKFSAFENFHKTQNCMKKRKLNKDFKRGMNRLGRIVKVSEITPGRDRTETPWRFWTDWAAPLDFWKREELKDLLRICLSSHLLFYTFFDNREILRFKRADWENQQGIFF